MIGSLLTLDTELPDDELVALIELAVSAVNGAPSFELAEQADRLAMLAHARKSNRKE